MLKRKKLVIKIISIILTVVLAFQTFQIGVFGALEIYLDVPKSESGLEDEYMSELTVFSGTHQMTVGRAGTFIFNDFTLIPGLSFDALSVASNIYPVDIKFNFNSSVQRFIQNVEGMNGTVYGKGWLPNYGKLICEVEYTDTREMFLFDGDGGCEIFVRAEEVSEEELTAFPQRQKWISKYGYSDTVIWKIPERYMDYSDVLQTVPEQYAVVDGTGEVSRYDAFGRLREKKNSAGSAALTVEYMSVESGIPDGISLIKDGMGNEFRFTYENNKLTKIKAYTAEGTAIIAGDGEAARALEVNFSYTGDNLTGFTFPDGQSISFAYDNSGNMIYAENIDNSRVEIEYTGGYVSKVTEKVYDSQNEEYVTGNVLTVIRNSDTVRTFTDNYGNTQIKTYDADGNILTIADGEGNILYDSTAPEEEIPEEETTEEETTEEEYVSLCPCEDCPEYECSCVCESEEVCSCIQCKRIVYEETDDAGNVTAQKVFDGTKTLVAERAVYSTDGTQLLSSTDSSGNTAYYTYDDAGNLKTVTAGSSSGTADYDAVGNLIAFSQSVSGLSDGSVMTNSYTYENDRVKTISHNGFTYEFQYDVWGNQTTAKIGATVLSANTYGTDEHKNRLSSTTFANGQTIAYIYDESDNITAVEYNGVQRYIYTYDEDGIMTSVTDNQSGLKTLYTENGTEIRKTADNSLLFASSSDENGNVTHNIAGDTITYVYDSEYNSVTGVYTDTVSFEKTGAITNGDETMAFTTNADIVTETDWFGRVTEKSLSLDIVSDDGSFNLDSAIILGYADTETQATTKVNSFTSSVTNGVNTVIQQEYYEYDTVGNITGIYRFEENEKVYYNRYYYDEANQIVREDNRLGGFTSVYTYDVGGNIVSRIRYPYTEGEIQGLTATETHTYSYENPLWGDVLTAYNGQPVTYDAMGNITSLEGDTYIWTAGRQLSRIIKADNSYIDYFYDDNGQLSMYKTYNADDTLEGGAEYLWDGTTLIAVRLIETDNEGMTAFMRILYDSDGEPLGFLLNDAMPFLYTKNLLGDITGVVNYENAQLMFSYAYDAYGNYELIPPDDSAASMVVATMLHALNPLTYRGYVFAPAIGISHYLGSRFYSPKLCRFLNADVYADTAQGVVGTNMFAYCNNNPISFVDPNGTFALTVFGVTLSSTTIVSAVVVLVCAIGIAFLITQIVNTIAEQMIIFTADQIRNVINSYEDIKRQIDKNFRDMVVYLSDSIYGLLTNIIVDTINSIRNYYTGKDDHHIVAKKAPMAQASRDILHNARLSEYGNYNIVSISRTFHKCLHTNMYHTTVYYVLISRGNSPSQADILRALLLMRLVLLVASDIVG